MKRILFLGDSITDTGRNDERGSMLDIGQGYACIASGQLAYQYPGEYWFMNKGISGNRIVDMYARIKKDCWNLEPDVISVLLGVNDVWHEFEIQNGVEADRFENMYRMLVNETKEKLPNVKFMLMEPFVLPNVEEATGFNYAEFRKEVEVRAQIVKKIAQETNSMFIPLQEEFDKLCEVQPAEYWVEDGVHPAIAGHGMMAAAWLDAFEKYVKQTYKHKAS